MGLFGNYENSGVGIAKDAPKKKPSQSRSLYTLSRHM